MKTGFYIREGTEKIRSLRMKDVCPHYGEPLDGADDDWLFGDAPVPQTPPWAASESAGGWPVQYEGDDDTAAVSADEWYEDDDPDPGVLADGRPAKIPSETRDRLWVYGYFTLKRMIRDGEIFEKCAAKDRAVRPSLDDLRTLKDSVEDRDALAGDTLTVAMKKVGETWSTWSPERGAKLETYFIGGLTLHFPAVFRQWQRNRWRLVFVPAADAVPLALRAAGMFADGDPGRQADLRAALEEVMRLAGPEVRAILARVVAGETQDEIAEHLASSRKAVEGRLYRFRRRLQEQGITAATVLGDALDTQKGRADQ
ncbi:RNA polymerase sigma factor [Streptomyces sennicomposti]